MRILYFDNLEYGGEYADFVICHHCENYDRADAMLVPSGTERCPICGDYTVWADDDRNRYEVSISEMMDNEEIIHVDAFYREEYDDMADETILIPIKN